MILKPGEAEGRSRSGFPLCRATGPTIVVLKVFRSVSRIHRREPRVGKWETCFWFSTFPSGAKPGCGNVEISRRRRDFQGAVGRVGNLLSVFHAFHGPGISTALLLGYAFSSRIPVARYIRTSRAIRGRLSPVTFLI